MTDSYEARLTTSARSAHVPFSGQHDAVTLVLEDGRWIPGVRVESASYSLTIPALLNAVTTAVARQVDSIRAVVSSRPFHPQEIQYARGTPLLRDLERTGPRLLGSLPGAPAPESPLSPFLSRHETEFDSHEPDRKSSASDARIPSGSLSHREGVLAARRIARHAFAPFSDFKVGCLLEVPGEGYIPGVNVEHADWMHVLCAERSAIGTAVSYGFRHPSIVYLSCRKRSGCTPCGACRQLLAELAPGTTLWMDAGDEPPVQSSPIALLPDFFTG
ncbi:MAG: cytidine deaminase [Rhodothermales bacterium]